MNNIEYIYQIENLSLKFGGISALKNISVNFKKGAIYGIIGPNGAGKSSFFNCLSGDYRPTSGKVKYCGKTLPARKYLFAQSGIYRTYQNIRLFDTKVIDNVKLGYFKHYKRNLLQVLLGLNKAKEDEVTEKAIETLETVGLKDNLNFQATQLPYGKQRLVEIARSLVSSPDVLLLDEPVAGMNIHEMQGIIKLIKKIFHKDMTIIIVEHHLDFLFKLCKEIFLFVNGELVMNGDKDTLLNNEIFQKEYLGN